MSRNIRVSEPSAEMQIKIIRAKDAIASQKPRIVRCPYGESGGDITPPML